jgi:hypothetical protein
VIIRLAAIAAFCSLAIVTGVAVAHPGHDHKVMGVIVAIDGDYVTIKTSRGHERSFQIVRTTTFVRGKRAGARGDLKIGLRLVVNVGEGTDPLRAKQIHYADAATGVVPRALWHPAQAP